MIKEKRKKRIVINIRDLNKIVKCDSYSMSLQTNIINVITNVKYISIINAATFFYQFRVRTKNKHKFIVMSHREQEYFSVTSMNFKNFSIYAQRRIDIILRNMKHFCRAFINDIIIFFVTLKNI